VIALVVVIIALTAWAMATPDPNIVRIEQALAETRDA